MVSHELKRLERLEYIKTKLPTKDKEKFIAQLCMKWGATRRTVMEYIKTVESSL